jgi:hypothetical protein
LLEVIKMQVRIQSTGQVMYESEFRAYQQANGGPSWDITTTEVLTALGADVVFEGAQATGGKTAAENEAEYKAAKDTDQAKSVRSTRDSKLAESDWRVIKAAETATTLDAAWATYRQALRDVTAQSGFPWTITWPDAP